MAKHTSTHAAAAKQIRAELKKNGVKASVRSESYAGGNAVRVSVQGNPLPATMKLVEEFCSQYQMGSFDGMQDMYEYNNRREDLPQVSYVTVSADYSDEFKQALWTMIRAAHVEGEYAPENYNEAYNHDLSREVGRILHGAEDWVGFWANHKPRAAA